MYYSYKMTVAKHNYKVYNSKLLVIVMASKEWRYYLDSSCYPIIVLTDHTNLKYFIITKVLTGRQA